MAALPLSLTNFRSNSRLAADMDISWHWMI